MPSIEEQYNFTKTFLNFHETYKYFFANKTVLKKDICAIIIEYKFKFLSKLVGNYPI